MRRRVLILILLVSSSSLCFSQPAFKIQTIPLPEVSGAVYIGSDRVLLIADEGYQVQLVSGAAATFKAGDFSSTMKPLTAKTDGSKKSKKIVDDIEDVAWDNTRQAAFVITSHSRSKSQDAEADPKSDKPARHKLARILFNNGQIDTQETDGLEGALKQFAFVQEAMKKPHQEGGNSGTFNIEGLAFAQPTGHLLIGLRSPTQDHDGHASAVVLILKNPHALFDAAAQPEFDPEPQPVDLGGLGIRGMTFDPTRHGSWIVAGRSADPDQPADQVLSSLWFWDLSAPGKPPRNVQIPALGFGSLEGVCVLERDGTPGLLLISDDGNEKNASRYVWIPIPDLSSPR
jgi:uncharacterized protein DUF3616